MEQVTLLVKTFMRSECLGRLLCSIREYYPSTQVIVADDSLSYIEHSNAVLYCHQYEAEYLQLPEDVGLCVGRNALVKEANTEFVVILEDDFIFSNKTNLSLLIDPVSNSDNLLVGGAIETNGSINHYEGFLSLEPPVVRLSPLQDYTTFSMCDLVYNFFATRRSLLLQYP